MNNAGIVRDTRDLEHERGRLRRRDQACTSRARWAPSHHAARHWRDRAKAGEVFTGRVINTTSGAGLVGNFGQTNYATAKAGIAGFTQTLSLELYKLGVTVNAVGPAAATRITGTMPGAPAVIEADDVPEDEWNRMDPAVSSPLVAWLASDESQHITGQVIRAVAEDIVWMQGWSEGPTISNGGTALGRREARPAARHRRLQDPRPGPALLTSKLGILVGPGVVRAGAVAGLHAFADAVGCGVVNTWGAKGVFVWDDPRHFGTAGLQARDFELAGPRRRRRARHERARRRRGDGAPWDGPGRGRRRRAARPCRRGRHGRLAAGHARAARAVHRARRGVRPALRAAGVGAGARRGAGRVAARGRARRRGAGAGRLLGGPHVPDVVPGSVVVPATGGPEAAWRARARRGRDRPTRHPGRGRATARRRSRRAGAWSRSWGDGSVDLDPSPLVAVAGEIVAFALVRQR